MLSTRFPRWFFLAVVLILGQAAAAPVGTNLASPIAPGLPAQPPQEETIAQPEPAVETQEGKPAQPEPLQDRVGLLLTDAQEARAQDLEGRLKCPVCRVQSVRESTSFMALEMRAKIRELIAAGRSDGEVLQFFVDRYGDYILLEPRKRGFGLAAYALPLLAVLAGVVLLLLGARRGRQRASAARETTSSPAASALSPADRERVEEELKRYTV